MTQHMSRTPLAMDAMRALIKIGAEVEIDASDVDKVTVFLAFAERAEQGETLAKDVLADEAMEAAPVLRKILHNMVTVVERARR